MTTTATHTPGPWKAVRLDEDGPTYILSGDDGGIDLLQHERAVLYSNDPTDPDALLIAAAPDLLEALRQVAEGKGRFSRDPLTHADNTIEDMKALAIAAIAKATGAE
jgi:hypothetical protein